MIGSIEERHYLPDTDRLSVLAAVILLAYVLLPFVKLPEREFSLQILGVFFTLQLNFATLTSVLSAALAAAGTDWLVRGHPGLGQQPTFQHWLLPALTTWVIGVPLSSLAAGWQWWAVLAFGGFMLVLVFIAEYIVVDLYDVRHAPAVVGLTAVSFALFLILTITLAAAGLRLYVLMPGVMLAIFLVVLRTLYLRLNGRWCIAWAFGISLMVGQFVAGLHYWPVAPLSFGLVVLGLAYALTSVAGSLEEGRPWQSSWFEPVFMLVVLWGLAVGVRG
jgi:hypothetical protein